MAPLVNPVSLSPSTGTLVYWTRPASAREWESEKRFLEPTGAPYRPWRRLRMGVMAIAWAALFEAVIHNGTTRDWALAVWVISLFTLLGLVLRTLCFQDDHERMAFARLQPIDSLSDEAIEQLKQAPDLFAEFQNLQHSEVPLLVGDWENLQARLESRPEIRYANAGLHPSPVIRRAWRRRLFTWIVKLGVLITLAEMLRHWG